MSHESCCDLDDELSEALERTLQGWNVLIGMGGMGLAFVLATLWK